MTATTERGARGLGLTPRDSRAPSLERIPYNCTRPEIVDHPEGGTVKMDCGLCPGCENAARLEAQAMEDEE